MILLLGVAVQLSSFLLWVHVHLGGIETWLLENPAADTGLALWITLSIANKLQSNPANSKNPFLYLLRRLADLLSLLPHADAKGVIGGALAKYMQPGPMQNVLQFLFGWYNLPAAPSAPNVNVVNTATQTAKDGAAGVSPRGAAFAWYPLLPAMVALSLVASCAFLQSLKKGELDCVNALKTDEASLIIPQITLLLATAGADWQVALAAIAKPIGKDVFLCSMENVVTVLEGDLPHADAGVSANADAGEAPAVVASRSAHAMSALSASPPPGTGGPTDKTLALFCAVAESGGNPLPDQCLNLDAKAKAVGRGRLFLNAANAAK